MQIRDSRGWQHVACVLGTKSDVIADRLDTASDTNAPTFQYPDQSNGNGRAAAANQQAATAQQTEAASRASANDKQASNTASSNDKAAAAGGQECQIIGRKAFKRGMRRKEFQAAYLVMVTAEEELAGLAEAGETGGTAPKETGWPSGMGASSLSKEALETMMREFPRVFEQQQFPPPSRNVSHRIQLKDPSIPPPKRKLYPLTQAESEELRQQVNMLLADGRIVPSASPYGAPVLFVRKKDGGLRMVIDYRLLNRNTITPSFPIPRIEDLLSQLASATVFSKLDLKDGYHTVRVHEEDQEKTAFSCRLGTYHWTVMPFGLVGAPATFMRAVTDIFLQCLDRFLVLYLDDLLIYSSSPKQHWKHLRTVFGIMRDNALHVKPSKCYLFADRLEFLGHVLSPGGIEVEQSKVEAVKGWPVPTCVKHIQQFLGLCNYYRSFIADFAALATPLSDLTRKNVSFVWGDKEQQAFDALKQALTHAPVLQLPSATAATRIEVHCDASDSAVGAVLMQDKGEGFKPVAYLSKRLNPAESNYPAHERELLAVIVAMKVWRHHLAGRPFVVKTDHQGLQHLQTQPKLSRRQVRWLETFSEFDFKIEYVPGRHNVVPDSLSRRPDLMLATLHVSGGVSADFLTEICKAQKGAESDQLWQRYVAAAKAQTDGYRYVNGALCREVKGNTCVVVPNDSALRDRIVYEYHDTPLGGHLGFYRVLHKIQQRFWWSGLSRYVKAYIAACETCQVNKVETRVPAGLLHPLPVPEQCWQQVSTDLITHLPVTAEGFDSIATFVDRLSKQTYFVPCKVSINAEEYAALFVKHVVRLHGVPNALISDRDPRFMGHFWRALFRLLGTKLCPSSSYHPESDGQTERQHRSIEQVLRCFVSANQRDWADKLPLCEFALNSTRAKATGKSPFLLNYGFEPQLPIDHALKGVNDCLVESTVAFLQRMHKLLAEARAAISEANVQSSRYANKSRRSVEYAVGDKVLIRTDHLNLPQQLSRKLAPKYIGPFEVVKVINPVAMSVSLPSRYKIHNTFHVSQLKPFVLGRQQALPPAPVFLDDDTVEYEVEDILDVRFSKRGNRSVQEYLIKWLGYPVYESTWEPVAHLDHCQELIQQFHARRGPLKKGGVM